MMQRLMIEATPELMEHKLGDEPQQPRFSLIGAFRSGRDDLSRLAGEDVFEPAPWRSS